MPVRSFTRRWGPFVALGLLVPLVWSVLGVALSDDRLATTRGALVVTGEVGATIARPSPAEPIVNVTVVEVIELGPAADVVPGDVIEVLVPMDAFGSDDVRAVFEGPVRLALRPAQTLDSETGNSTWTGWALSDGTRGRFWGLQRQVLGGAALNVLPSVGGALLLAYALGMPQDRRRPAPIPDGPGVVAGAAWAVLLAAGLIDRTGVLFPNRGDEGVLPGVGAWLLLVLAVAAQSLAQPVSRREGGTVAIVTGVGLLAAPALALWMLWGPAVDARFALGQLNAFVIVLGAAGAVAVFAARFLELRATRVVAAVAVLAPPVYLWGWTGLDTLAAVIAPLSTAIALDMLRPRWLVRLMADG